MARRSKKLYKKKGKVIKDLSRKIIHVFNTHKEGQLNYKQIASVLGIDDSNGKNQIIRKLGELKSKGKVVENSPGKFKLNLKDHYYTGTLDFTSNGNAYFICDELDEDVFIPSRNLNRSLHGDTVKVYVYKRKQKGKVEGDVMEVLERRKTRFVGVFQKQGHFGFVVADNPKVYSDFYVNSKDFNKASDGDKVIVELMDWPEKSKSPFGRIIDVLGKPGDHDTEIHSILNEYDLPYEFPQEVMMEASEIPREISEQEIAKRRDFRNILTFTIDPEDAKDFDDALSYEVLEDDKVRIGVHIADVSHYVQPKTLLDDNGFERGTSVYLVDRVVPMLPEELSNGLCSLRPKEEKLCFSAVFDLDKDANITDEWFGRTVIYSDHRFTYEQAQEIIEGKKNPYQEAVLKMDELAKIMRKSRLKKGALSFDKTEVKFILNDKAEPQGVYFKTSKDSNKLIEEFMLLANRRVAEFIGKNKNKPSNKTFVYRVHDQPDIDKLDSLNRLVSKFGFGLNLNNQSTITSSLNKLLEDVKGNAASNMVETLAIRSMSKAEYTTDNIGHYGLAFPYYTHFTSPIRRYPDILVHRLLQHYLDGGKSPNKEVYEDLCEYCSTREQIASKAERDSIKYMQVKYMEDHKDEVFDGVISGVTEWGIYVEIIKNKCEGMVRSRDLNDDFYIFNEDLYALEGQSTGNLLQLGDLVKVKVKHADLERKRLDFDFITKIFTE